MFLYRVGRACTQHRWRTVLAWLAVVVALVVVGRASGGEFYDRISTPGSESEKAIALLSETFPTQAGGSMTVVFHSPSGTLADPEAAAGMTQALANIAAIDGVTQPAPAQLLQTSDDGTIATTTVRFEKESRELGSTSYKQFQGAT
jgi:RND superfamily putative drug exporter